MVAEGVFKELEEVGDRLKLLASGDTAAELLQSTALNQVQAIRSAAEALEAALRSQPPAAAAASDIQQSACQVQQDVEQSTEHAAHAGNANTSAPISAPKLVQVPVRRRSALSGSDNSAASFRQMQLPCTPFFSKSAEHSELVAAEAPGGKPADTPVAAEVLASLGMNFMAVQEQAVPTEDLLPNAALASILGQGLAFAPPVPAYHAAAAVAAAVAAAAAGPAPVSRPKASGERRTGCNCKRSMCLKMYCDCFSAGGFCAPGCSCMNCQNTEVHVDVVQQAREVILAKDPRAFEVKVTAADGHKRGCRCKRSKCLKKYCECFNAGASCNPDVCACEGCRNTPDDTLMVGVLDGSTRGGSSDMPSSGDDDYVPTALTKRNGGRRARASRQASLAARLPPLPLTLDLPAVPADAQQPGAQPSLMLALSSEDTAAAAAAAYAAMFAGMSLPGMGEDPGAGTAQAATFATALSTGFYSAPASLVLNPVAAAAAAAATFAAAATMAGQAQRQQLEVPVVEESMVDAVQQAAPETAAPAGNATMATAGTAPWLQAMPARTPPAHKLAAALTSHLSDMLQHSDPDVRDTASSPAPLLAIATLATRRGLLADTATLTGGGAPGARTLAAGLAHLPLAHLPLVAASAANSQDGVLSLVPSWGSVDGGSLGPAGDSLDTSGSQRPKRPYRAASGGVLGAVAAEAAGWGLDDVPSPPLKRANSMPTGLETRGGGASRKQVAERVMLLKRALAGDSHANIRAAAPLPSAGKRVEAEEEDAVSALFELSTSVC